MKFKVLKSWIDQGFTIIFQVQIIAEKGLYPKKAHLLLDLRQQSFGVTLGLTKPEQATANAAFVQILRKHLPSITIKQILQDPASGDLWIPLLGGVDNGKPWMLRLAKSRPPLASLLDPQNVVHVSYGQKGTFTKKHQDNGSPLSETAHDLLPELLQALKSESDARDGAPSESEDKQEGESEAEDSDKGPLSEGQKDLISRLKRKLKTTKKNIEKIRADLPSEESVVELEKTAFLLQGYAYLIRDEAFELILDPSLSGFEKEIRIPLDPERSRGRNIEAAFERFRKARKKRQMSGEQLKQNADQVSSLERDLEYLRAEPRSESDLNRLIQRYRLPALEASSTRGSESEAKPYKTYRSSTGHAILVGKGASENDELTKAARSNDYWFHAVGVTGSHVIVPITADLKQALPSSLLQEASLLALHFSRLKDDLSGECYVTRKAFLKKQKGMPAGLWRIDQSETVFIRYTQDELQKVLQTLRQ